MEDSGSPASPNSLPKGQDNISPTVRSVRKPPSPQELISHYESQGLTSHDASIKVIDDLQNALFRIISSGRGNKDKRLLETSRKLDATNSRLAVLDLKLDSKPGYAETFALGEVKEGDYLYDILNKGFQPGYPLTKSWCYLYSSSKILLWMVAILFPLLA
ncbi:hypothetical protein Csa_012725 [Cucumis sativus]|nr:hypothetical protein Csa_012725 [Cucumis sativus]